MAETRPFELAALRRDWIHRVSGQSFHRAVLQQISAIESIGASAFERGVLIAERDPVRFAEAFFAAMYVGVPVVLANPDWGTQERDALDSQVNPALVLGDLPLNVEKRTGFPHNPQCGTVLIPTGGSSSGVKLTVHTWQTLSAACESLSEFLGKDPIDSCCTLPLFHVSGLMQLMRSFLTHGQIVFLKFQDLESGDLPGELRHSACLSLVPTQLQRLLNSENFLQQLCGLRAIFIGGGAASNELLAKARALRLPILLCYGMTETAAMVAVVERERFLGEAELSAMLLPNVEISIVGDDGMRCLPGVKGRICIATRSLFRGYHARSPLDLKSGYLTDDEGVLDESGRLTVLGRLDRLINTGGEKVDPREVEEVLMRSGKLAQVLVLGLPDVEWGERVVAFYVLRDGALSDGYFKNYLKTRIARFKIPKCFKAVQALPLNSRGKVDRALCEQLILDDNP